uniref:Uncharacterized protein n=1 Tax=Amphora coffeiformis TaxID=265554 RepID=A0A7S3P504_9STRA
MVRYHTLMHRRLGRSLRWDHSKKILTMTAEKNKRTKAAGHGSATSRFMLKTSLAVTVLVLSYVHFFRVFHFYVHIELAEEFKGRTSIIKTSHHVSPKLEGKEPAVFEKTEVPSPPRGRIVQNAETNNEYFERMDAMCTLQRYTHLFYRFCDPSDHSDCEIEEFKAYYEAHKENGRLEWGCPLEEALCYAVRYPDLLQGFCFDNTSNCKYHDLRRHYETHGIKERRVWGCYVPAIQPAANVSVYLPLVTLPYRSNSNPPITLTTQNIVGKASIEHFQGSWESLKNLENFPNRSICPELTSWYNRFCSLETREGYTPAQYVAKGLPEFSAKTFVKNLQVHGGIGFVGDSLMLQLFQELKCQLEAEGLRFPNSLKYFERFMPPFPDSIMDQFEVGRPLKVVENFPDRVWSLSWVDEAVEQNLKYIVYTTGAWWNPLNFHRRGEWCDYGNWRTVTREELLRIYFVTMEETLLPLLTSLVQDHGIIPIWMDQPPAGKIDQVTGEIFERSKYTSYYEIFPKFNEVGRETFLKAGGLVLPIWDATFPRWQDHLFGEKNDHLHWCTQYGRDSVPAVWARLLSSVLFGDGTEKGMQLPGNPQVLEDHVPLKPDIASTGKPNSTFEGYIKNDRLSSSHRTSCHCSNATAGPRCRANIICVWDKESEVCSERTYPTV